MDQISLAASKRNRIGKKVRFLRREGKLPAILYGKSLEKPIAVTMDLVETSKALRLASASSLFLIDVDGEEHTALVRDFQIDFLRGDLQHVDFLVVSLTETVRASVTVLIEGEAPIIKSEGGFLVTGVEQIEVESLPQNLPGHFRVDVSAFENFGDALYVRDLAIPADVSILTDLDELIVVASAPVEEMIEEEVVEEGELLEGEELPEGEELAEGEEAADGEGEGAEAASEEE